MDRFFPRVNNLEPGSRPAWLVFDRTRGSSDNEDAIAFCGDADDANMIAGALNDLVRQKPKASGVMTRRELDVARLMATGMAQKEIGYTLGIARSTVNVYARGVYAVIGVSGPSRAAVALQAWDLE